jgi:Leucine-rich repeat (LRR) protein
MYATVAPAQEQKPDTKKHEQKVRDMVAFLEYVLNTVGSGTTSARDKDVLITESYTKIFRDSKVQIEDDLVEKRNVITNKDVQAYLKDVDFFYDDLKFEFTIKDIQGKVNANDRLFYKVSLLRNIQGTTVEGKLVNNTIPRYIEINFDPKDQDLKIVSIYTKEFDEKGALQNWWKTLSFEWQSIFQRRLNITDSVDLAAIKNISSIESLDLSGNQYITDIEPLAQLSSLQILNLSNTNVSDLSPIRNLTELIELDFSDTQLEDISALKYSDKLTKLKFNHTPVADISVLERMTKLQQLDISETSVMDFDVLSNLTDLKHLSVEGADIDNLSPIDSLTNLIDVNVSRTLVENVSPLRRLKNLAVLNLDSTKVSFIQPLSELTNLRILHVNSTSITDLNALQELPNIERIYCDQTKINRAMADAFMATRKGVLVIYDTKDLKGWWDSLPVTWQKVLRDAAKTGSVPTNEELAKITNLDSINVADNTGIHDVDALERLQKLQSLVVRGTEISSLSPLQEHKLIRTLDISNTNVGDINIVRQFSNLAMLRADNSKIQSLDALAGLRSLKSVYADGTAIKDDHVREFLNRNPECLVVYKTDTLLAWWSQLSEDWKGVFNNQVKIGASPKKENLHRLIEQETLKFQDVAVNDLSSLGVFVRIKELGFSGTALNDISPLSAIKSLRILKASNSPIRDLTPLVELTGLQYLDISSTAVEDLRPLGANEELSELNCSGTQVSNLSPLENLSLTVLDCSNTNVKKLEPLFGLPLETLKCYNTRVSAKEVEKFKGRVPGCNVIYYR